MSDYPDDWFVQRHRVYERDNYQCKNCTRRGGPGGDVELHAHHIVPKSRGGTHRLPNLVTLCKPCHAAVHSRSKVAPTAGQQDAGSSLLAQFHSTWRTYKRLRRKF